MDTLGRQEQSEGSEDEEDHFTPYMDENGVIGLEEQGILGLEEQGNLGLEEQGNLGLEEQGIVRLKEQRIPRLEEQGILGLEEQWILGLEEQGILGLEEQGILGLEEQGILRVEDQMILGLDEPYPGLPSDEDPSGKQSWNKQFSFSQTAEERSPELFGMETLRSSDIITMRHDTDDPSSEDNPGISLSLPPPLDWRPPSRDKQLDMTEDEQDRGSSVGIWEEEEEEERWSQEHSGLPYNDRFSPGEFEEYGGTSTGEEQWDNHPVSSLEERYPQNPRSMEDEPHTPSLSPSSHPVSSPWGPRLPGHLGKFNLSPRIEDETLPESSCTETGEGSAATHSGDSRKAATTNPVRAPKSESIHPSSTPPRWRQGEHSSIKPTKSSAAPLYGQGQLNYPLPDFSKVGPRVRFPRDEPGYRPPRARRSDTASRRTPVIFKSPAEIVQEVLLSSTEEHLQKPASLATVPQEFKTPKQATELVHQLQEDYHKLLTKYAEAENTIDRLRLGARVNLYADPPKPSHIVQMGTVMQGSKVMTFTIPQMQAATFSSTSDPKGVTQETSGSPIPRSATLPAPHPLHTTRPPDISVSPSHRLQGHLTAHIGTLQGEVDLLEELLHAGSLTSGEQQQAVCELRLSLGKLERKYLQAREDDQGQRHTGTGQLLADLDPDRVLEGAIFQLGMRLDELKDRVDGSTHTPPHPTIQSDLYLQAPPTSNALNGPPAPSAVAPIPSLPTPYPEVPPPPVPSRQVGEDVGSMGSEGTESQEEFPQPLRHKQMQVEREYDTLLSTYTSFKTLPDALGLDQIQDHTPATGSQDHTPATGSQDHTQATRPQDHTPAAGPQDHMQATGPLHTEKGKPRGGGQSPLPRHTSPSLHAACPAEHRRASVGWEKEQTIPETGRDSEIGSGTPQWLQSSPSLPPRVSLTSSPFPRVREQRPRSPAAELSVVSESARGPQSRRCSVSSRSVSSSAQKVHPRDKVTSAQDRIVSPETDSGFLGSESGGSPIIQNHRVQPNHSRDLPAAVPAPSNSSPPMREVGPSQTARDQRSGTRKAFWGRRLRNDQWADPSQASSPSPGPHSLTESESRGQSPASETESEGCSDIMACDPSFGASVPHSPVRGLSQPHRDVLETRAARDRAIHDLQEEVSRLRQRLEQSLNRASGREKLGEGSTRNPFLDPRDETGPRLGSARGNTLSDRGVAAEESKGEPHWAGLWQQSKGLVTRTPKGERGIRGAYTGTQYYLQEPSPTSRAKQDSPAPCSRCQDVKGRSSVHVSAAAGENRSLHVPPPCPMCHGGVYSADNQEIETSERHRPRVRSEGVARAGPWVMGETPSVSVGYIPPPPMSYPPAIIFGPPAPPSTSSRIYLPAGYSVAELHPPRAVTAPPAPGHLQLEDLSWPLSRALEAAQELKGTSRRMCRSLTSDLSLQRSLRGSCLF